MARLLSYCVLCCVFVPLNVEAQQPDALSPLATSGPKPTPITPPTSEEVQQAILRGVDFLLEDQNDDGSWGTPQLTKELNIYAPVPGAHQAFRAAVTALCYSALVDSQCDTPRSAEAIGRGKEWLLANLPRVRRATGDALYNVWAHAYGIQALVQMRARHESDHALVAQIDTVIAQQIDLLERYELVDGGWGYYDYRVESKRPSGYSSSFTTATVLVALVQARGVGASVPEPMITRATAAIRRLRKPDFSYIYGESSLYRPLRPINLPASSLGRSQACNLALRLTGDKLVTDKVVKTWLDRLWARNGFLSIGRKRPIPHESFFMISGYFYYYGHYYAAMCIGQLPAADRAFHYGYLAHTLLPLQEKDGSWWDYPLYNYHQQYGTAMAISALSMCRNTESTAELTNAPGSPAP